MITLATIGTVMSYTGCIGLAGLFLLSKDYSEYVVDIKTIKSTVDKVLPNNVTIIYVEDKDSLYVALNRLSNHLYTDELQRIKHHYVSHECYGLTFKGSTVAIVYVNEIRRNFKDIKSASKKLWITIFHEVCHRVLDSSDEELVSRKALELYEKHKDILPSPFIHCDYL